MDPRCRSDATVHVAPDHAVQLADLGRCIAVDLIGNVIKGRALELLDFGVRLVCGLFFIVVTWMSFEHGLDALEYGDAFNLLPIPPFDGSHIVEGAMPRRWVHIYEKLRPFGMLLFVGLVALTWFAPEWGVLENTIGPPVNWALEKYLSLAAAISGGS